MSRWTMRCAWAVASAHATGKSIWTACSAGTRPSPRSQLASGVPSSSSITEERLARVGLAEIEHAHDRRMAELRRRARLPEQPLGGVGVELLLVRAP